MTLANVAKLFCFLRKNTVLHNSGTTYTFTLEVYVPAVFDIIYPSWACDLALHRIMDIRGSPLTCFYTSSSRTVMQTRCSRKHILTPQIPAYPFINGCVASYGCWCCSHNHATRCEVRVQSCTFRLFVAVSHVPDRLTTVWKPITFETNFVRLSP